MVRQLTFSLQNIETIQFEILLHMNVVTPVS